MALSERIAYDSLTILEDGQIQVRRARVILDTDGSEITRNFFRKVLEPGQDVSTFPVRVQAICTHIWTPQVVTDYLAAKAARAAALATR